jgi:hypothetical protein
VNSVSDAHAWKKVPHHLQGFYPDEKLLISSMISAIGMARDPALMSLKVTRKK